MEGKHRRCLWTGRADPGTREIELEPPNRFTRPERVAVCPLHEQRLREFVAYASRRGGLFLALIGLSVFAGVMMFALVGEDQAGGAMLASLGAVITVFPFATPQTVALIGVRNSVIVARTLAIAMFFVGIGLLTSA